MNNQILIRVGTLVRTSEDFLIALSSKVVFDDVVRSIIIGNLFVSHYGGQKEIFSLSPACLGLNGAVERTVFFQVAQENGYKLCDLETVLQYLLQRFKAIQTGELYLFAMEPIKSREDNNLHMLGYRCHDVGDVSLIRHYATEGQAFYDNRHWLFCK